MIYEGVYLLGEFKEYVCCQGYDGWFSLEADYGVFCPDAAGKFGAAAL